MSHVRSATIIGGGIGGLIAALALQRVGIEVAVYEQASDPPEQGAGLWLWANALRALELLEIAKDVRARGVPGMHSQIRAWHGGVLADLSAPHVAIHRADLQMLLLTAVGERHVHHGMRCVRLMQDDAGVTAYFAHGRSARGDVLIGADGMYSTVRAALGDAQLARYAGFNAWRAVIPFQPAGVVPGVSWGCGVRFGYMPLSSGRLNWFAAIKGPPAPPVIPSDWRKQLLALFRRWHAPIAELIDATSDAVLLRHGVYDRSPLPRWSAGRVTLLGDAAHPMTPSLGQGACQAIEDAVVLARCCEDMDDPVAALQAYERSRLPRTRFVARRSAAADRVAQLDLPVFCTIRDTLVRRMPRRLRQRQLDRIVAYRV